MSRRCLICSNINPCRDHSEEAQDAELRRNTHEVYNHSHREERKADEAAPPPQTASAGDGETLSPDEAWQQLLEVDDRTSPAEYPDHCLITRDELGYFMSCAKPSHPASLEAALTQALEAELADGGVDQPYSVIAERVAAHAADNLAKASQILALRCGNDGLREAVESLMAKIAAVEPKIDNLCAMAFARGITWDPSDNWHDEVHALRAALHPGGK